MGEGQLEKRWGGGLGRVPRRSPTAASHVAARLGRGSRRRREDGAPRSREGVECGGGRGAAEGGWWVSPERAQPRWLPEALTGSTCTAADGGESGLCPAVAQCPTGIPVEVGVGTKSAPWKLGFAAGLCCPGVLSRG